MTRAPRYPLTVFYDASCPMCAGEMCALKELDRDGRLALVDCSAPDFDDSVLAGTGISRAALMTRIHARDSGGRWLSGIDVFEAAYGAAGLLTAGRLWGSRRLRPVFDAVYPSIARHRQLLSRLGINALIRFLMARLGAASLPTGSCRRAQSVNHPAV